MIPTKPFISSFGPIGAGKRARRKIQEPGGQFEDLFRRAADLCEAAGAKSEMKPLTPDFPCELAGKGRILIRSSGIEVWKEIDDAFESAWTNLVDATEKTQASLAGK